MIKELILNEIGEREGCDRFDAREHLESMSRLEFLHLLDEALEHRLFSIEQVTSLYRKLR